MYVVLGIGNFGYYVAKTLFDADEEVLAIDRNREKILNAEKVCSKAVVGDVTDKDMLRKLEVHKAEAVFVGLGDDMAASILVTLYLKDMGAQRIIVKAISEDHERILKMIGADYVVFPERDTAVKTAKQVLSPNMLESFFLTSDYTMVEMSPIREWEGKTLAQADIRRKHNLQVVAIKSTIEDKLYMPPPSDYVLKTDDILIIVGRNEDIKKLQGKI